MRGTPRGELDTVFNILTVLQYQPLNRSNLARDANLNTGGHMGKNTWRYVENLVKQDLIEEWLEPNTRRNQYKIQEIIDRGETPGPGTYSRNFRITQA